MSDDRERVKELLRRRRDDEARALLSADLTLVDEDIVRLALDHGCVKTIRLLRKNDLITAAGKEERERIRLTEYEKNLAAFDREMADIEELL